ncbi:nodal modulator 1 [Aricia agestis]|uniref:nodal modulator 1 n=1 Tax=Aricia agestis TaxID=91739 RepID=UPI001C2098AD|nr:nodal modulator 1 [Aricia agestis]
MAFLNFPNFLIINSLFTLSIITQCRTNDILGCGGFVKSHVSLDFSKIEIGLYTREGSLKEKTECAPTNGYYFLPLYEKGDYVLRVHPPAGWSFEPSHVDIVVDGETDPCSSSQDINFSFNGFGITGQVITASQKSGPSGVNVQLVNEKGDVRNAVTTAGGEFHFTPVIPGKYVVKASHSKWKLEPSQTVVQVKEGNTVLPVGSLAVRGYDVTGSVHSFGSPISGIYVLLYSKEENPKFRVEGCKTALLQGVPDAPICYSVTDASGEFSFGLVPAGDYKLLALAKSPGQTTVSYNIKPDIVPLNIKHDSLFIRNAFEVTGFNVVGSVLSAPGGSGMAGVRVLMGGEPIATTNKAGQFPMRDLKPGVYTLTFQHEQCEIEATRVQVSAGGVSAVTAAVARWRVCGALAPPSARTVSVHAAPDRPVVATARADNDGKWCTFLPPGTYSARVEVSEQEQREGLQFYPEWRSISVGRGAVTDASFSMVRVSVRGRVRCGARCGHVRVTLRPLAADGSYTAPPRTAELKDEQYVFEEVSPGSVEVSAVSRRVCFHEPRRNVLAAHDAPPLADFEPRGLLLRLSLSHESDVEYESETGERGSLALPAGESTRCLPAADRYTLTPRGCHRMRPASVTVDMTQPGDDAPLVSFLAEAHAATVTVSAPSGVTRCQLLVTVDGATETVNLKPVPRGDDVLFEHTLYLAEGAVAEIVAQSPELVWTVGSGRVRGAGRCQPAALRLRGARAQYVRGRIAPPVSGVTVTLTADNIKLTQITPEDGAYSFGPLDATLQFAVTAHKESYSFGERRPNGDIPAQKLAEIIVELVDDADGTPLEGAVVSASGGQFRRNVVSDAGGRVRLTALGAAQYYVKPNMKEYKFAPPHHIHQLPEGETVKLTFRGTRVAWSAVGRAVTLGGAGAAAALRARPAPASAADTRCAAQEATADSEGHFRIRGLQPGCVYTIELKESAEQLELARAPPPIEVRGADVTGLRLVVYRSTLATDSSVLIRAPADAYRSLRLTLAPQGGGALLTLRPEPPAPLVQLPRLPADNKTYVVTLETPRGEIVREFVSDGVYKHFDLEYKPEVRGGSQEVRGGSMPLLLLLGVVAALVWQRDRLVALVTKAAALRQERAKVEGRQRKKQQ